MSEIDAIRPKVGSTERLLLGAAACLAAAAPTLAADAGASSDAGLEEVVVTATRQGEFSIQKVPIAMSVVSAADLDSKGLAGLSEYFRELPSVNMQSNSPGENDIEMRGMVTQAIDITNTQERSLVSVYLDDSPISLQGANPDLKVYDLERVEVLRGPQGTLYGAGSMAGTIRYISKKPDAKELSGSADVSVSDTFHGGTNTYERGVLNLPLIEDKLAARLSLYRSDESGFIDNLGLNQKDANPDYTTQGRLALRWQPADKLTVDLSGTYATLDAYGRNDTYPALGKYTYTSLTPEHFTDNFRLLNLAVDWDMDFAHLISSSSYVKRRFEQDSSFQFIDEALATPGSLFAANGRQSNDIHDFTQEFRLVSAPHDKFHWIVGAFYDRLSRFYPEDVPSVPGFDATLGQEFGIPGFNSQTLYGTPEPNDIFYGTINIKEQQAAVFGELTYNVTPQLNVTAGLRYFNFHDDFSLYFTGLAGALGFGQPSTGKGSQNSNGVNPRLNVSYQLTDSVMVFAEGARGFRYGGVNEPVPLAFCATALNALGLKSSPESFGPDHLWSYTLGEKGTFDEGKLLLNADVFYIDWSDAQTIKDIDCGYYFAENAGKIKSQGVELESKMRVTRDLTLGINASFTDATANGAIANVDAADGDRVPFFPRTIATGTAAYSVPLPVGKLRASLDYTYRSAAYTEFSLENPLVRKIPASRFLSATLGYEIDRWSVSLYGTNLTNDLLESNVSPNLYAPYQPSDTVFIGRPRTIGVHVHVDF